MRLACSSRISERELVGAFALKEEKERHSYLTLLVLAYVWLNTAAAPLAVKKQRTHIYPWWLRQINECKCKKTTKQQKKKTLPCGIKVNTCMCGTVMRTVLMEQQSGKWLRGGGWLGRAGGGACNIGCSFPHDIIGVWNWSHSGVDEGPSAPGMHSFELHRPFVSGSRAISPPQWLQRLGVIGRTGSARCLRRRTRMHVCIVGENTVAR